MKQILPFKINDIKAALEAEAVELVIRAVALSSLPKGPKIIEGLLNFHQTPVPVVNLRKRFNLPFRSVTPFDHFIVVRSSRRKLALWVDAVFAVESFDESKLAPIENIAPNLEHLKGVMVNESGLIYIFDLDSFLSLDEEKALDESINAIENAR